MSRPIRISVKCAVCGEESNQTVLASTNRFGSPDLDLRPPEMMRSTMRWWIQECPHCGYVSGSLDDETSVDAQWLKQESYISANSLNFASKLAGRFYKDYLISVAENAPKEAFYAALHAAWACDDSEDFDNSILCRKAALEQLDILISKENDNETYRVMRMDLLRRSGQFSSVVEEYENVRFSQELLNRIKDFQLRLARQGDTDCYTVADCAEE